MMGDHSITLGSLTQRLRFSRNSSSSSSEVYHICRFCAELSAIPGGFLTRPAYAGEACINFTQTSTSAHDAEQQPVTRAQLLSLSRPQLLEDVVRRLHGLLQSINQHGPDGELQPDSETPATDNLVRLMTACSVITSCAAAVNAAAQHIRSAMPQLWTADGLTKGKDGLSTDCKACNSHSEQWVRNAMMAS